MLNFNSSEVGLIEVTDDTDRLLILPIVLALFLALFGFASTGSIILDFRLITCIILC